MDNRIKRMQCLYQFRGVSLEGKPTVYYAVIEQTPNTRGGYLIAFAAGLLTYSSLPRLPSLTTSGRLRQPFVGTYSSRYCSGFPFNPCRVFRPSRNYNATKVTKMF